MLPPSLVFPMQACLLAWYFFVTCGGKVLEHTHKSLRQLKIEGKSKLPLDKNQGWYYQLTVQICTLHSKLYFVKT